MKTLNLIIHKNHLLRFSFITSLMILLSMQLSAQGMFEMKGIPDIPCSPLIGNIEGRTTQSLNGTWNAMIDPVSDKDNLLGKLYVPYIVKNHQPQAGELMEFNLENGTTLQVPGDWNTQDDRLYFYNGKVWYKRDFHVTKKDDKRYFLYFGAINYKAHIFVNGTQVASHIGGYTSFNCEVTEALKDGENLLVIKVDNTLTDDEIPTASTDWMNYGGITRDVYVAELPKAYIQNYKIQLAKGNTKLIEGSVKIDGATDGTVSIKIPELKIKKSFTVKNGEATIQFKATPKLWSPKSPKLYNVELTYGEETVKDQIGFRTIEVKDRQVVINGKPIMLKGISIHEEAIGTDGRAYSYAHAEELLKKSLELGCNYVRLAHYTHNEHMVKAADKLGLMVWAEIPVYWSVKFEKPEVLEMAKTRMSEMILRDQNRASIIFWSLGNETPVNDARNTFFRNLNAHVKGLDNTRLTTAALVFGEHEIMAMSKDYFFPTLKGQNFDTWDLHIHDPLAEIVDVGGINQYFGWYYSGFLAMGAKIPHAQAKKVMLDNMAKVRLHVPNNRPFVFSETGAGAKKGLRAKPEDMLMFSEDFQALVYEKQIEIYKNQEGIVGMSPWVLKDFRATLRQHQGIQDYFNRKGLIDDNGQPKKAFFVLQKFYNEN